MRRRSPSPGPTNDVIRGRSWKSSKVSGWIRLIFPEKKVALDCDTARTLKTIRRSEFLGRSHHGPKSIARQHAGRSILRLAIRPQRLHTKPMRDLMIHRPAHEAMKMLGQAIVAVRDEGLAALRALIGGGPDLNDLSFDGSRRDHDIVGALMPRLHPFRSLRDGDDISAFTERTRRRR